jgi:tetratricopeptide (TPR) repeat protein
MRFENVRRLLCARAVFFAGLILSLGMVVEAQVKKPAPPAAFRAITVATEPGAVVWIDDVRYGKADARGKLAISTIAAGSHRLRVRADGFKEVSLGILPTQKGEIKVPLAKTTDEAELAFQKAESLTNADREAAAENYRKAIQLRPKYPEAFIGLARVLMESGDLDGAKDAVNGARKVRPVYPEASAIEGRIYKDLGEEAKAIASFKRAITDGKGFQPEAYTGLGLLYKEKAEGDSGSGDFEQEAANYAEASKNLRVALKQLSGAPDTVVIYQLLGLIYERLKKYDDAIAIYEEFLRIFPNSNEAEAIRSFITQIKKQRSEEP